MTTTSPSPQAGPVEPRRAAIGARTLRIDRWWVGPLTTAVLLGVFLIYTLIRFWMRQWYYVEEYGYLTPMYSPCLSQSCLPGASHFGQPLPEFPMAVPVTIITLVILLGFRATCYYYRKATYRSFLLSPPGCAVREPAKRYSGERRFPLVVQNYHRYFFYIAGLLLLINVYDAILAFFPESGGFGVGLGSLLMLGNVILLGLYTLSCHACRHIFGGRLKHFSKHPAQYWFWTQVSKLNGRHMQFAWISLFGVMITDFYIMSVAAGWIPDLRIFN